ncbi:MAG: ribosomal protein S18-alanine N-acetyltransferase [Clostridia bacterium]|nr:ribosomal protein S18-alanine N-acetyltransferase [Clostridia bacterium]
MVEPKFRKMDMGDLERVYEIELQSFPTPWPVAAFERELDNELGYYCVCELDGQTAGFCGMWVYMGEAQLTNVAIAPEARRKGVASRMVRHMIGVAVARGAQRMSLEVREHNEPAKALYRSLGFVEIGVRKNYYLETRENAIIMAVENLAVESANGGGSV